MTELTWDEVLANKALIGGDIESQENGIVYRGPLAEIKDDGDVIRFNSPWCARLNPDTGEWENWDITSSFVSKDMVKPDDTGDGRICFAMPFLGFCTIFPNGGSKLDPSKVKGLNIPVESKPLHVYAPSVLKTIAKEHATKTGVDLQIGQAEFRGAMRMLLCKIPKGHAELRQVVRDFALIINMTDDPMTEQVLDHIEDERQKAEVKQAA